MLTSRCKLKDALNKRKELNEGMEYYLKLQLFVRDKSVTTDNNLYIIFLCTIDGRGSNFIPLPPNRKEPDASYFKRLKRIYKMLTRPWVTIECMVEAVESAGGQPVFFLVDTSLQIK